MNKYIETDNQDGYTHLKVAIGGAFAKVLTNEEEINLQYISPSIVIDFLESNNLSYNKSIIIKGKGNYKVRFKVSYTKSIIIEVDMMTGNTYIKRI
jgi:hypothetical protein